ncbi:MAG TPA: hypothetical protein VI455_15790 [Terriglobia bacterium]
MSLQIRRRSLAITAAAAVLVASWASVVGCAELCGLGASSACPYAGREAERSCHPATAPGSSSRPGPTRSCPGHVSIAKLTARVMPAAGLSAVFRVLSAVIAPWSFTPFPKQSVLPSLFSHSPPFPSGRTLCQLESLLRI